MPKETTANTVEEKLDVIIAHLEALDRRDKLRTTGAFIRSILAIIPLLIFLWSAWYAVNHAQELMQQITTAAATAAAEATKSGSKSMLDDLLDKYDIPTGSSSSAPRR
jgi:hypothetical protein